MYHYWSVGPGHTDFFLRNALRILIFVKKMSDVGFAPTKNQTVVFHSANEGRGISIWNATENTGPSLDTIPLPKGKINIFFNSSMAFASFRAAALQSAVTSRKLAAVGASFTRQQRQQLLRGALLNVVMQGTFTSQYTAVDKRFFLINVAN